MQGCIILNSRYFSRRQDSELVAINLYVNVPFIGYFLAVYTDCLQLLPLKWMEMPQHDKFYHVACFSSFICSLRKFN